MMCFHNDVTTKRCTSKPLDGPARPGRCSYCLIRSVEDVTFSVKRSVEGSLTVSRDAWNILLRGGFFVFVLLLRRRQETPSWPWRRKDRTELLKVITLWLLGLTTDLLLTRVSDGRPLFMSSLLIFQYTSPSLL